MFFYRGCSVGKKRKVKQFCVAKLKDGVSIAIHGGCAEKGANVKVLRTEIFQHIREPNGVKIDYGMPHGHIYSGFGMQSSRISRFICFLLALAMAGSNVGRLTGECERPT